MKYRRDGKYWEILLHCQGIFHPSAPEYDEQKEWETKMKGKHDPFCIASLCAEWGKPEQDL